MKGHNLLVLNVVDPKMLQKRMPIVKVNGVQNYTGPPDFHCMDDKYHLLCHRTLTASYSHKALEHFWVNYPFNRVSI